MAEIDLVSIAHAVDAAAAARAVEPARRRLGLRPDAGAGPTAGAGLADPTTCGRLYGQSIQYSMRALVSFVQHGPRQQPGAGPARRPPARTTVSGTGANDVPISLVAHDPAVLDRIASWGWQDGLLPSPTAPVWPMDAFRDRFLDAFGATSSKALEPVRR